MKLVTRTAHDGVELVQRRWEHPSPTASLVLIPGLGEHTGRYEHVGAQFHAAGFDVRGTDQRGYGRSGGPRAYADSIDTLLDDLGHEVAEASALGVPVCVIGHSVGGFLALLYATSGRPKPAALVLSSPAIRNTLPVLQKAAVRVLGRVAPRLTIPNPVDATQLSRDQAVGERYLGDPLVLQRASFGYARAAFDGFTRLPEAMDTLDLPTLVTHGSADTIVRPEVSEVLAGRPGVERLVYPDLRHEPFNEDGGTEAVATIVRWLSRQLP